MRLILIAITIIILLTNCSNVSGLYSFERANHRLVLRLKPNLKFKCIKYNFSDGDLKRNKEKIVGKWMYSDSIVSFHELQPRYDFIRRHTYDPVNHKTILIEEVIHNSKSDGYEVGLVALNKKSEINSFSRPEMTSHSIGNDSTTLKFTFNVSLNTNQIIFYNFNIAPYLDLIFEGGVYYNNIDSYNSISINNQSTKNHLFISPLMRFKVQNNTNLESLKLFTPINISKENEKITHQIKEENILFIKK